MGINLFGFQLGKKDVVVVEDPKQRSFALPTEALDDGAVNITQNAYYGTYVDLEGAVRNEMELITRYREMSNHPELESAISDITNEAISREDDGTIVEINLDNLEVTDNIKKFITGEYKNILSMLNFSNLADDLFKRWYIDGRLYFHVIVNETNPRDGIQELRYIDPRKIRKIREIAKERDNKSGLMVIKSIAEYYVYNERALPEQAFGTTVASPGIKIAPDSIVSVTSGLMDARNAFVVSYLNSAIKPLNQLRMIEDAVVIYRISRSPERRIFYVDVGNLPKGKAEQYLRDVMVKYRNKLVYNQCLALDTVIPLLDGRKLPLNEIISEYNDGKTLWAYSCDPNSGKFAPGKITWAGVTKKDQQVMKITFDNGKYVICTPDHKHVTRNNGLVESKDLQIGDSMMPFYTRNKNIPGNKSEYEQLFENEKKKWIFTHRLVSAWKDNNSLDNEYVYNEDYVNEEKNTIHHKTYNRFNNNPDQLTKMYKLDHFEYHKQHSHLAGKACAEKRRLAGLPFFNLTPERRREISIKNGKIVGPIVGARMFAEKRGIHGLSKEETIKNAILGSNAHQYKLKNDKEYYNNIVTKLKNCWTDERRIDTGIRATQRPLGFFKQFNIDGNKTRWNGESATENKKHLSNLLSVKYTKEIIDLVTYCIENNYSKSNTIIYVNDNKNIDEWKLINATSYTKDNNRYNIFTGKDLIRVCKKLGFNNWLDAIKYYHPKQTNDNISPVEYNPGDMNRITYPDNIMNIINECVDLNLNAKNTLQYISDKIDYDIWNNLNIRKYSHKRPVLSEFSEKDLYRLLNTVGHSGWRSYKEAVIHTNHKIVNIEYLPNTIDVGTLTIDGDEEYHNYHTFALDCGIFTKNSDGSIVDSRKHMSMLEDFFIPRRDGSKSTEITTLPGGGALSNLDDIDYFKKKLLQALHVPYSRLEPDGGGLAALGRTTEITRDELKFAKFIDKLRNRFSQLFDSILRIQLSLKGICTQDEWDTFREHIYYDYKKDNNFAELRESELLRERLGTLAQIDPYIGKYYSITWIKKNVLRQSDEEIEEINKEMKVDGSFEILQQSMVQDQPNIQKESFELI